MHPDDHVCLCFGVSLGKVQSYLARENPPVASLISQCLGAGTGCGWCVRFLQDLHAQHQAGQSPTIAGSADDYKAGRLTFKSTPNPSSQKNPGTHPGQ